MKQILITNDDGFEAEGLKALKEALTPLGNITIVAPSSEKSACGHSLTLTRPLRLISIDDDFYKLDDGTPSDCIYLSLATIFENNPPDIVVSGINKGANLGEDITYSGTASGAMEASLHNIPSVAISQVINNKEIDYELSKEVAYKVIKMVFDKKLTIPHRRFLNINIPNIRKSNLKGFKVTKAGYRLYTNDIHRHINPRGEEYFWLGPHPLAWRKNKSNIPTDFEAINNNFVSITPIKMDMTAYDNMKDLEFLNEI